MFRKFMLIATSLFLISNILFASPKNIVAKSYCLIDASTAQIIAGENYNDKLPIASTTKIMTALIALEQEKKYDYFTVDENAIKVE
ncbi:MAG: D-alanyl-D-alanine carboxypeptidase, partial [Oscillospiraceae bacterium]